jgi:hypothetical protein
MENGRYCMRKQKIATFLYKAVEAVKKEKL